MITVGNEDYAVIYKYADGTPQVNIRINFTRDHYTEEIKGFEKDTDRELIKAVCPLTREQQHILINFKMQPQETQRSKLNDLLKELDELGE